VQVR